jgi:hypothetical protein
LKVVASILPKETFSKVKHLYVVRAPMPAKDVDEWLKMVRANGHGTAPISDSAPTRHEPPIRRLTEPYR